MTALAPTAGSRSPLGTGTTPGTSSDPVTTDAAGAGEGVVLSAPGAATTAPTDTATVTGAETAAQPVLVAPQVQADAADDDLVPMPWIGLYVMLGCLLISSLLTTVAIFRRK